MARALQTIWCDDIRMETGNKYSLMGIYAGELLVPSFPFVIEKLCLNCKSITDIKKPFKQLKIVVTKDKEVVAEVDITESLPKDGSAIPNVHDGAKFLAAQTMIFLRQVVIEKPVVFRAKLITETGVIKGHGLMVRLA